jgi:hypothetical protein
MTRWGWTRKYDRDAATGGYSPLPTQVVGNEEYLPPPPTREQARVAALLHETAGVNARRLGIGRRAFLASGAGMAAAFLALNRVFGRFFEVDAVEALEPAAADARRPPAQFVFDVQTHHVAAPRQFPWLPDLRRLGRRWNPELGKDGGTMDDLYLANYINFLRRLKAAYLEEGPRPSLTQYGWVRR